ncbi:MULTISPECIES: TRAP transporter substrate-binding protein DctP [unclassified Halomonas]|uniref:TRAP transporter substrate-binding protein DctP n=1 Tax=unclassified Halomonas TaxID=2609666 RepID=UPI0028882874|nr:MULTISPECIES: TRAP transporter substrate-binding protein DctP [unclassified Halomonas]MDT0499556.1 TRAP transporter substrate-binding protein DctP [Halomonas sp. PAR7]MDT0510627.1 TRAP transporter substrate-binding protein DctP [Halomonas sp. LES1]MDT0592360.1 TRAP transporter substrate-binding protein DctP [Halomonas sp. PAR8]
MHSKKFPRLAALAALPLAMAAVQAQAEEMAIATILPENMSNNEVYPALIQFKNLVETRTDGEITVSIFGNSQLGSEVETASEVQGGRTLQSTIITTGAMSSFYDDYQLMTAPFIFDNWRQAWAFFDGDWFADFMSGTIEETNMRYLGTFDDGGGFVAFTNNERLIKTVEDLEGLNIRTEENPGHVAIMKSLGASATPLPWGEVVTALETGLADGQFNAPVLNTTFNFNEVTDYTTLTGHVYNSAAWLVSEEWFQSLTEEQQQAIVTSAREAIAIGHGMSGALATASWVESCERFEECYIMPPEERARMAEIATPAWKEWIVNDFGIEEEKVDAFLAEVKRVGEEVVESDMANYGQ